MSNLSLLFLCFCCYFISINAFNSFDNDCSNSEYNLILNSIKNTKCKAVQKDTLTIDWSVDGCNQCGEVYAETKALMDKNDLASCDVAGKSLKTVFTNAARICQLSDTKVNKGSCSFTYKQEIISGTLSTESSSTCNKNLTHRLHPLFLLLCSR